MESAPIEISPIPQTREIAKVQISASQFVLNAKNMDVTAIMYTSDNQFVKAQTVHIPDDVYAEWGQNDDHIVDYVLTQLGIHKLVQA